MKLLGNPSAELGIDYHSFSEHPQGDGTVVVRYVLCKPLTRDQVEKLKEYSNVKFSKDGATYKYAPEIKYDVLYITESIQDEFEEDATEDLEQQTFSDEDDSDEVLRLLDEDISGFNPDKFVQVAGCIDQVNNLILLYKQMGEMFPESKELFNSLVETELLSLDKLQAIKNSETNQLLNEEDN